MKKEPLVSIITPCFNDAYYINETIESVQSCSYTNFEHIIIDDGSTDSKTIDILNRINKPQVKVIHTINQGVCKARNTAIKASKGKYILPLDADDLISSEYIRLAVQELEANELVKLVSTNYKKFGKENKKVFLENYNFEKLLGHNLFHNSTLFRRIDFDIIGGYNENMYCGLEDWDFWIGIMSLGGEVINLNDIHFYYRIKKGNFSRNKTITNKSRIELRRQIWENHRELYSQVFPDPLQTFEYINVAFSFEYRLSKILFTPIRKMLNK